MTEAAAIDLETGDDVRARAFKFATEMHQAQPAPVPGTPWYEHKAFQAIEEAQSKISLARAALAGISAMLQPESNHYDEQMNMTRRSDASAVFGFFAEAMRDPLDTLDSAAFMLQSDLRAANP